MTASVGLEILSIEFPSTDQRWPFQVTRSFLFNTIVVVFIWCRIAALYKYQKQLELSGEENGLADVMKIADR